MECVQTFVNTFKLVLRGGHKVMECVQAFANTVKPLKVATSWGESRPLQIPLQRS